MRRRMVAGRNWPLQKPAPVSAKDVCTLLSPAGTSSLATGNIRTALAVISIGRVGICVGYKFVDKVW